MANSPGMSAVGIGGIGFGVLLVWSAYTNTPVFGEKGVLRALMTQGSFEAAKSAGKAAGNAAAAGAKTLPKPGRVSDTINTLPAYDYPPGYGLLP